MLVDESRTCKGAGATPLMRAAFTGDVEIARALLGEVEDTWPETVRKQYLDQRTTYGFTAYMIACACGREMWRLWLWNGAPPLRYTPS